MLRWQPVKGAAFYNVQLYRNGVKVLSTWPPGRPLKLGRTWRYAGKLHRLEPGVYRWYVWGAQGTRAKPAYGNAPRHEHLRRQALSAHSKASPSRESSSSAYRPSIVASRSNTSARSGSLPISSRALPGSGCSAASSESKR